MRNYRFIETPLSLMLCLTATLLSCGGEGGDMTPGMTQEGQIRQVSEVSARTAVLRDISITPVNPLGINAGTRLHFTATGSYSDNSLKDITTMVVWTSSDTSIATISNDPASMGLATAVSKGYGSISATLGGISSSTIIGVN